ncbi:vacuolar sorting protein VPS33/slp1 [Phytophthora boehmeriae]|uniref:Vacuolar sorting protein VPS33/slp1 n=1 Tax=Phytophthora boehmeriae TaxID=109152 RepID=A0A8T1WR01_9STRA|nr:vacuolar sorting protein VPS33/slp1 [Phytophthora boehmeriae]
MRVIPLTFLFATALLCAFAQDAAKPESVQPGTVETQCLEPSAVKTFETKIADLERSNSALLSQVDEQEKDQKKVLTKVAKEHEEIVVKLQEEIKTLTHEVDVLQKDLKQEQDAVQKKDEELQAAVAKQRQALEKKEQELQAAAAAASSETGRISELQTDIEVLEKDVAKERAAVAHAEAELKAALAKLAEETARVAALKKSALSVEKRNKILRKELEESKAVELTMASLLSSYYDEGLIWAELGLVYAMERLDDQSGTLQQVQDKLQDAKKTACEASSKFYADNLAATLDPILENARKTVDPIIADVHKTVNPHVEKYLPIMQSEATKAKTQVVYWSQEALRRAKLARLEAIKLLEQNEHVAAHAQKVIDGVLIVLAVPLVWLQLNLVLRLVWWLFTTTLCVLTCGLCCGARKRGAKSKRKIAKKTPSGNLNATLPLNGAAKKSTTKTTTTTSQQKRNKKGKH